jgi:hypothetical protein
MSLLNTNLNQIRVRNDETGRTGLYFQCKLLCIINTNFYNRNVIFSIEYDKSNLYPERKWNLVQKPK